MRAGVGRRGVAAVIEKAIRSRRPRSRYVVGPVAHTLVEAKRVLPGRALDLVLRSQYRRPR